MNLPVHWHAETAQGHNLKVAQQVKPGFWHTTSICTVTVTELACLVHGTVWPFAVTVTVAVIWRQAVWVCTMLYHWWWPGPRGGSESEPLQVAYHEVKERQVEGLIVTARRCHQSEKVEEFRFGSEDTGSPNLSLVWVAPTLTPWDAWTSWGRVLTCAAWPFEKGRYQWEQKQKPTTQLSSCLNCCRFGKGFSARAKAK